MRVAILSESSADETALRILVDAVLGIKTTPVENLSLRSRSWQSVKEVLIPNAKMLHYRTNADALVIVVDSNHTYLSPGRKENRLEDFQELVEGCRRQLGPVSGRVPLKIAIGVACPAIEAWWLCKTDAQINEAAWEKGLDEKRDPYSKLELKKRLYGQEFNSLDWMTQKMVEAARNLENDLSLLERYFPNGFGTLAKELRNWRKLT